MTNLADVFCSDVQVEPLPGTAKTGSTYVLLEWPGPWSRDVLDGNTLGAELSTKLKAHLAQYNATLLLIRHTSRARRDIPDHHVYLVFADEAVTEVLHVNGPEAVLDIDLSGPGKNGAQLRDAPLVLVCTHGKRDRCCAVKGRPLVNALHERYPFGPGNDVVWETSHIKGHRFAPTMLLMPWAYSFGRMNIEATDAMLADAAEGRYFVPGNRGRGTLGPVEQVAELAVAAEVPGARYGQFEVELLPIDANSAPSTTPDTASATVTDTASGHAYEVQLEQRPVTGVMDSCGKAPKEGLSWVAAAVTRVAP